MIKGLLGRKLGMTQVFDDSGKMIPVTVIEAGPCYVLGQGGKPNKIRMGFNEVKDTKVSKPMQGQFKKSGSANLRYIREVDIETDTAPTNGQQVKVDIFNIGDFVDITGTSIGKGFQGGVKRWHWRGGPRTHGSTSHRRVGSVGSSSWPSRIWKGHHLPGHMGACKVTRKNIRVVKLDVDNNLLIVKGPVPGPDNNFLIIQRSLKKSKASLEAKSQSSASKDKAKEATQAKKPEKQAKKPEKQAKK